MTNDNSENQELPTFERDAQAQAGKLDHLTPLVRRLIVDNPSPFTFTGTCTYIVGRGTVAVIDPGPDDPAHLERLRGALSGEQISHIVVTHTHKDHSPGARLLGAAVGAPIVGCAPHFAARPPVANEQTRLDASADRDHAPDQVMRDGDEVAGPGWTLKAVETPGHTANHLAFALPEEESLFSGDHVMAWSTTIVAPPDGSMADYMASLDKLRSRSDQLYWPGHGGPVKEPRRFVRALVHHRRQREASILTRLRMGDRTIQTIVPAIYEGLNPALYGAAALSVFAHIEDLVERGQVATDGVPVLTGEYRLA